MRFLLCWIGLGALLTGSSAWALTTDWVTVGDPGNACDVQSQGCFGAVDSAYRISKYATTSAQYAEFLNAVATADTRAPYHTSMGSPDVLQSGITRSRSPGSLAFSSVAQASISQEGGREG